MVGGNFWLVTVGCVLVISGLLKANYTGRFFHFIKQLQILPKALIPLFALFLIESEVALGLLLICNIHPQTTVPLSGAVVASLSLVSIWAIIYRKTSDCGCYGGVLPISSRGSLVLNAVYLLMLWIGFQQIETDEPALLQLLPVLLGIGFSGYLAKNTISSPGIDFSKINIRRQWQDDWVTGWKPDGNDYLLVMMNEGCSQCKNWIIYLEEMALEGCIRLILLLPESGISISEFKEKYQLEMPVFKATSTQLNRLTYKLPTGIHLSNRRIADRWVDRLPDSLGSWNE